MKNLTSIIGATGLVLLLGASASAGESPTVITSPELMPSVPSEEYQKGYGSHVKFSIGRGIISKRFDTTGGYNPNVVVAYLDCFEPVLIEGENGFRYMKYPPDETPGVEPTLEKTPFAYYSQSPGESSGITRIDSDRDGYSDLTFASEFPKDTSFEKYAPECKKIHTD